MLLYIIFIRIILHCPLSGPYISLLIIPCIIYYVTNKETLTLTLTLEGPWRRKKTLEGQRRCEETLKGQRRCEETLEGQRRREETGRSAET